MLKQKNMINKTVTQRVQTLCPAIRIKLKILIPDCNRIISKNVWSEAYPLAWDTTMVTVLYKSNNYFVINSVPKMVYGLFPPTHFVFSYLGRLWVKTINIYDKIIFFSQNPSYYNRKIYFLD